MALEEAKAIARHPMTPHLKQEREEFISRANLALEREREQCTKPS
jgi:hypothetical protein